MLYNTKKTHHTFNVYKRPKSTFFLNTQLRNNISPLHLEQVYTYVHIYFNSHVQFTITHCSDNYNFRIIK